MRIFSSERQFEFYIEAFLVEILATLDLVIPMPH